MLEEIGNSALLSQAMLLPPLCFEMTQSKAMSYDDFTVFVVDPNPDFRDAMTLALGYRGYCLRQFSSQADFVAALAPDWRGCVVASVKQPQGSGLDFLVRPVGRRKNDLPLPVVLTGGDTAEIVRQAFLSGAIDILPSAVDIDQLLSAIDRAVQSARDRRASEPARKGREPASNLLTKREVEVATLVRQGFDNRSVGARLGISHRTVEVHKTRLMRKLGVRSLSALIAMPMPTAARRKPHRKKQKPRV